MEGSCLDGVHRTCHAKQEELGSRAEKSFSEFVQENHRTIWDPAVVHYIGYRLGCSSNACTRFRHLFQSAWIGAICKWLGPEPLFWTRRTSMPGAGYLGRRGFVPATQTKCSQAQKIFHGYQPSRLWSDCVPGCESLPECTRLVDGFCSGLPGHHDHMGQQALRYLRLKIIKIS